MGFRGNLEYFILDLCLFVWICVYNNILFQGFSEQVKHMNIIADATGTNFAYHGLIELQEVFILYLSAFY